MKVALVGVGYWGAKVLRNLVSVVGARNVVAVEPDAGRLAAVHAMFPDVGLETGIGAALDDPDVGAVVIATPVATHAALARRALAAGRHCLVEKPLTSSVPDAAQLAALAEKKRLVLMVGHTFVFSPRVELVASCVDKGEIGNVHYAISSRLNLGTHRNDVNVIWDLAAHDFSIIMHLFGETPSVVQSTAQSLTRSGMPDVAFVNLTFPSGAIASVLVSWLAPRKVRNTVLVGERGMIVYDDTEPDEPVKIYDRGVLTPESASFGEHQLTYRYGSTVAPHVSPEEPLHREIEHFVASIHAGGPCLSDGRFGLEVVTVLDAADRSWRQGGVPCTVERRSAA